MWGISDTSVSFCENKYEESKYIAEFYNTISSLSYMIVAYPFLRTKIKRIGWSCMGVGIGSILLHGTGRYYGQWVDEISMLLYGHTTLRYLDRTHPNIFPLINFISPSTVVLYNHLLVRPSKSIASVKSLPTKVSK